MRDMLDRPLRDLRISVTDRCNMRCRYCMPREVFGAGHAFLSREDLLSFEEIERVATVFAALGVRRLRLTGGEPLLRRGLERLVGMLAAIESIEEVALTTNGLLLAPRARALADAGLSRVTVSLDALEQGTLRTISDVPVTVERVLRGIDAALTAGLRPVKVNMVVQRDVNDDAVPAMAERFRDTGAVVRFIEYMDVGASNGWRAEQVVSAPEIRERIEARWPLAELPPRHTGEVATRYRYLDGSGEIGLIHSVSAPFCDRCSRARLSADGQLFTCLFARQGHDLKTIVRSGADDAALAAAIRSIWVARADRYSAERDEARVDAGARVEMSYIGG